MKFEFHKDMQGFGACQDVNLQLIEYQKDKVLMCKCKKSNDFAGIIRTINLPKNETYTLEVVGSANNLRTFLHVEDAQGKKMYVNYVFLGKDKKSMKLEFTPTETKIKIGVIMGGDSIATTNDFFVINAFCIR